PEELADLGGRLQQVTRHRLAGLDFHAGALDGRPVVLAEAGLGKVNAAMVATLLLQELGCRAVIFSGVAGGLDPALAIGDVVIGERLVAHDYGAIVAGELKVYQPGGMPLPGVPQTRGYSPPAELLAAARTALADLDLPELSAAATGGAPRRPRLRYGTILTGDVFVNCVATRERLFAAWQAQAVEMEGAAIAQVD